jgi:hypothetical protein
MNKVVTVLVAMAIPLGMVSADVHAASKLSRVHQIKVCLTSIGWCSDFSKRTSESTSCYCRNHQQNPGRVTTMGLAVSGLPQID